MGRFFLRLTRLTTPRLVFMAILLWLGVAVALAGLKVSRTGLLAYGGATMVYAFVIAAWAMLRTYARLKGLLDEGEAPDGGLLLETLPMAAIVLNRRGRAIALNSQWLELFELPRNQVDRKRYEHFCDPVLRRVIARVMRDREAVNDLRLSARTPDGANVFFRADVSPLGEGALVTATPAPGDSGLAARHEAARYRQIGQAAAAIVPRLLDKLPPAERDAAAPLTALMDWTHGAPAKTVELGPAALLAEAVRLAEPAFAAKGATLQAAPAQHLPRVLGRRPQLLFSLTTLLFLALDAVRPGETAQARVERVGEDVEWTIDAPLAAATSAPGFALLAARQIAREHDGDLRRLTDENTARLVLRLPVPTKEG